MTSQAYTLSQIVSQLGGEWKGKDIAITAVRPLDQALAEHISFLANPKYKAEVHDSQAGAVIVSPKAADEFAGRNLIVAADPYLYFAKVARLFSPIVKAQGGVHPTAVVEASAKVPASCEIGANAYIGANAVLGEGCRILANAVVQHDCTLGDALWATVSKSTVAPSSERTVSAWPSPAIHGLKSRKPAQLRWAMMWKSVRTPISTVAQ